MSVTEYGRHFLRAVAEAPRSAAHPAKRDKLGPAEAALATMAEEVPSSLFGVVESAVDPLEIAASLETCGLSNAVVRDRLGWKDVFTLAEQLYTEVQLRAAPASDLRPVRMGNISDLGRRARFRRSHAHVRGRHRCLTFLAFLVDAATVARMRVGI